VGATRHPVFGDQARHVADRDHQVAEGHVEDGPLGKLKSGKIGNKIGLPKLQIKFQKLNKTFKRLFNFLYPVALILS
jgi:hypothetical protein